ncbi:MAG: carbohydrate kinase [Bacteroidales bacterium]|jgi:fructokinase|nr:carbohydrate kinase [Bacteroidales bacterium]
MKTIVGLGEILWDVFPEKKILGGAPANFAYHASQLGFNGYAVSAIGNDLLGDEILSSLSEKKLDYLIERIDFPTGTVQVTLDEKGVPQYEICENVAWDNIPFSSKTEELARTCSVVSFGSLAQRSEISRATIHRFLEAVPSDALKIFDINLRQHFYNREIVHDSLQRCNILKINDDEVAAVALLFDYAKLSEQDVCRNLLQTYNLKMVIETKGDKGSYVFTTDETSYLDTPKVEVVDTVGAGDAFTAAFVASLLRGKSIQEAHQLAVDVAAYVCTQSGAMPQMPQIL